MCNAHKFIHTTLQIVDARNVIIIVSRWYGGILLGPDRFKHINNSARTLLGQEGFIKNKVSVVNDVPLYCSFNVSLAYGVLIKYD